nr:MAG TPA: hypothetical protein [Caudoviricetes sp.]
MKILSQPNLQKKRRNNQLNDLKIKNVTGIYYHKNKRQRSALLLISVSFLLSFFIKLFYNPICKHSGE